MRLQFTQNISNISTLQDLVRFSSNTLTKIQSILNGNVDLIDNGNNQIISFSFTKINIDVGVAHSLGTTPRGYINVGADNTLLSIKNGSTPNTASTLYLQSGSTGTVKVMVF